MKRTRVATTILAVLAVAGVPILLSRLASNAAETQVTASRRVVLISCDGLRPDALGAEWSPTIWQLITGGSFHNAALCELPPATLPNHTSMLTGLSVGRHGVMINYEYPGRIEQTTIFDVAKAHGLRAGCFLGKSRLRWLCNEGSVEQWGLQPDTAAIGEMVRQAIAADDLHLIFVHFAGTDGVGHASGWMSPEYMAEVTRIDEAIRGIRDAVAAAGVLEETVFILTADHGGHEKVHYLDIPDDRHIPIVLNGPGVAVGRRLCQPARIMDVPATVLHLLHLPTDSVVDGLPLLEAMADVEPAPCSQEAYFFTGVCGVLPFLVVLPAALSARLGLRRTMIAAGKRHGGALDRISQPLHRQLR